MVVELAVTVSARAVPQASATRQATTARAPIWLVAIEGSIHVGRGRDSGHAGEDDVSVGINRLRVAGDTPGSRHPGRMSRELRWDAVTGGPALAVVGRNPVGRLLDARGPVCVERLAATVTVRTRASRETGIPCRRCALRPRQSP